VKTAVVEIQDAQIRIPTGHAPYSNARAGTVEPLVVSGPAQDIPVEGNAFAEINAPLKVDKEQWQTMAT
jgi:hypothetical protein